MSKASRADRFGRIASWAGALCVVHCVLTALAFGLLSAVGLRFVTSPAIEVAFFATLVIAGGTALFHGLKRHHSWVPALVFVAGLASIAFAHLFIEYGQYEGSATVGAVLAVTGGVLVATFQLVNSRLQHHRCACESHHVDRKGHALEKGTQGPKDSAPEQIVA